MLATVVTIPSFLGSVRGFLPLQEAPVLFWVALPQFVLGIAAMALMSKVDSAAYPHRRLFPGRDCLSAQLACYVGMGGTRLQHVPGGNGRRIGARLQLDGRIHRA